MQIYCDASFSDRSRGVIADVIIHFLSTCLYFRKESNWRHNHDDGCDDEGYDSFFLTLLTVFLNEVLESFLSLAGAVSGTFQKRVSGVISNTSLSGSIRSKSSSSRIALRTIDQSASDFSSGA